MTKITKKTQIKTKKPKSVGANKKSKVLKPKTVKKKNLKNHINSEVEALLEKELLEEADLSDKPLSEEPEELSDENEEFNQHKKDLEKLKETDLEFYKFLQKNDKGLLQFSLSDEESTKSDSGDEGGDDSDVHQPNQDLLLASDESDFEAEDAPRSTRKITLKMVKKWHVEIKNDKSNKTINAVVQAFHAALNHVTDSEKNDVPVQYELEGSAIFNAVVQLCVLELGPAVKTFLGIQPGSKQPLHKYKKFKKIKNILKLYFSDLLLLLSNVTSVNIRTVILKHVHYMSLFLNSEITKKFLKKLIQIWGGSENSLQVLAFLCIVRIIRNQSQTAILDRCLKAMYMTYMDNSKFVNVNSLASINFMKRSLVEVFSMNHQVAYAHVFLFIRQLAIQLRNAVSKKSKEECQAVCNWQFVNSLRLWGSLLSTSESKEMQHLIFPLVEVCLGTIKLFPTTNYYPLRFHIIQILIDLTKVSQVFVPVAPFLLEVLTTYDFDKKSQKGSLKPLNFTCLLRLSKSQVQENSFKDVVIDLIYTQVAEYLTAMSHTVAFPDLSLICVRQIKQFVKTCKTPKFTRKLKPLLDKIEENSKFVETERSEETFKLSDENHIKGLESRIKAKGTPLASFLAKQLETNQRNNKLPINQ